LSGAGSAIPLTTVGGTAVGPRGGNGGADYVSGGGGSGQSSGAGLVILTFSR
jgi:hypothetical protein